jgi:hypothetical protein
MGLEYLYTNGFMCSRLDLVHVDSSTAISIITARIEFINWWVDPPQNSIEKCLSIQGMRGKHISGRAYLSGVL